MSERKLAAITGASSGIGRSIAKQMATHGYDLLLIARREHLLTELSKELEEKYHVNASHLVCDLSKQDEYRKLSKKLEEYHLDYFFNNAGVGYFGNLAEQNENRVDDMTILLINSLTYLTSALCKQMTKQGGGVIVNISSIVAFAKYSPGMSVYSAAKKYVYDISRATQFENEKLQNNVRVVALQPGAIKTEWQQNAMPDPNKEFKHAKLFQDPDKFAEVVIEKILNGNNIVTYGPMGNAMRTTRMLPAKTVARIMYARSKTGLINKAK